MGKTLNLNNARRIPAKAFVEEISFSTTEGQQFVEAATTALSNPALVSQFNVAETASVSPIGEDGKPRMLRITAWIAHAGKPNKNGDAFREEDLREAVQNGLFRAPALGMIDFNHDFLSYGAWYDAEYKYDPQADEMGILATGAIFAWRYEDLANTVLAMQVREGFVPVSMAAIPESIESAEDDNGRPYWVLVKPVFFTTSVLDVEQADPNARGTATEDPFVDVESMKNTLVEATKKDTKEDVMEHEELIKAIRALLDEVADERLAPRLDEFAEAVGRIPGLEQELADVTTARDELQTKLDEATVALEATRTELTEANEKLEEANEKLTELEEFKADAEAKEEERLRNELIESRLEALPKSVRKALEAADEETRERMKTHYANMEDAQWEQYLADLNLVKSEKDGKEEEDESYLSRSRREGTLSGVADPADTKYNIDRWIK